MFGALRLQCLGPVLSYNLPYLIFSIKRVSFHSDYLCREEAYNGWRIATITFYCSASHIFCTQGMFLLISLQACQIVCLILI